MTPLYRTAGLLTAVFIFGAGVGCADAGFWGGGKSPTISGSGYKPTPWVTAPPKANGSGVSLKYSAPETLKAGETITMRLQLSNVSSNTGARMEMRASDPSVKFLVEGAELTAPVVLTRDEVREFTVQISTATEGLYYLSVFTTQDGRFTAASIPLQVGAGAASQSRQKAQGNAQVTPKGERVISLPGR